MQNIEKGLLLVFIKKKIMNITDESNRSNKKTKNLLKADSMKSLEFPMHVGKKILVANYQSTEQREKSVLTIQNIYFQAYKVLN